MQDYKTITRNVHTYIIDIIPPDSDSVENVVAAYRNRLAVRGYFVSSYDSVLVNSMEYYDALPRTRIKVRYFYVGKRKVLDNSFTDKFKKLQVLNGLKNS